MIDALLGADGLVHPKEEGEREVTGELQFLKGLLALQGGRPS